MALNDYLAMMKDFRKLSLNGLQRKVEAGGLQDNLRIKDCLRDCWGLCCRFSIKPHYILKLEDLCRVLRRCMHLF
jgi:hypothetical protein